MIAEANGRFSAAPDAPNGRPDRLTDIEAERRLLAAYRDLPPLAERLPPSRLWFTDRTHQTLAEGFGWLLDADEPITPAAIAARAARVHGDDPAKLLAVLNALPDSVPDLADHDAARLVDLAGRRRLRGRLRNALAAVDDAAASVDDLIAGVAAAADGRAGEPFTFIDLPTLLAKDTRQRFLIDNALPAAQTGLLFAPAKCLKTTVACDAALSMTAGVDFLGWFEVPEAVPVGIVSGESGEANIRDTLARQCAAKGIDPDQIGGRLQLCFDLPQVNKPDDLRHLRRLAVKHGWRALFLDPKYLLGMVRAENHTNLSGAGEDLRPLAKMAAELGLAICIVDHARKNRLVGRDFEPLDLFEVNGSGGSEFARWWWTLNRAERPDFDKAPGRHSLWFSTAGNAGHGTTVNLVVDEGHYADPDGRRYCVRVRRPAEVYAEREEAKAAAKESGAASEVDRRARHLEHDRERIVGTIRRLGDPQTKNALKANCGVNGTRFGTAWETLEGDGTIASRPARRNGRTLHLWGLSEGDAGHAGQAGQDHDLSREGDAGQDSSPPLGGLS